MAREDLNSSIRLTSLKHRSTHAKDLRTAIIAFKASLRVMQESQLLHSAIPQGIARSRSKSTPVELKTNRIIRAAITLQTLLFVKISPQFNQLTRFSSHSTPSCQVNFRRAQLKGRKTKKALRTLKTKLKAQMNSWNCKRITSYLT